MPLWFSYRAYALEVALVYGWRGCRVVRPKQAMGTEPSQKAIVNSIRRELSFIHKVLPPRPYFQMLGVYAATVIASMANHVVIARRELVPHTENEAISMHLMSSITRDLMALFTDFSL